MPVKVEGMNNIVAISAGGSYSMAIDENGNLWVWGGVYGDLYTGSNVPVQITLTND